jgi:hypothetical protein
MKRHLLRAKQIGGTLFEAARRAVDPPLAADATPIEIRQTILDSIEQQVRPVGGGRRALPAPVITASVLAPPAPADRDLKAALKRLEDDAIRRLQELQCEIPPRFAIEVTYLTARPDDWNAEQCIDLGFSDQARSRARTVKRPAQPPLQLTVVKGRALQDSYTFATTIIRVGRSETPTDSGGRPRHNDVAFLDDQAAENTTVTRAHARIQFSIVRGDYRVFDEGSANGTQIIRGGEVVVVQRSDPMGVVLQSGDELRFGKASVRVQIGSG